MINVIYLIVQVIVIILVAPLVNGIINKVKAFTQKRKGAPLLQMYFDLFKLIKKSAVVSDVSSWIFKATPYIVFSTSLVAALLVPVTTMISPVWFAGDIILLVYILAFIALFIIIIAETSRTPVDDPSTHLELTMVHEAMVLEYSGRSLALMELGAAIKQLLFITLLVNIFIPHDQLIGISGIGAVAISLLIYLIKVISVSILIAIAEVSTVKLRLFSIPNLAALSFILSFLGFLQYFVLGR